MNHVKILKRQPKPADDAVNTVPSSSQNTTLSLEEREVMYLEAKARIFKPEQQTTVTTTVTNTADIPSAPAKAEYWFKEDGVTDPE